MSSLDNLMLCFYVCSLVIYFLLPVTICIPKEKGFVSIAIAFHMGIVSEFG